jgi:transposase
MITVGIDIGKRTHEACFMGADGLEVRRSLRFTNSVDGVQHLLESLQALEEPATIGLEASGHYWFGLQRFLVREGLAVQIINPLQTVGLRAIGVRKTKTDRRDAFVLADLMRIGRAKPNYVPDDTMLQLRELTRFRWSLIGQVGDIKRRILAVLDRVFPEFAEHFSDPFGATARQLLTQAASAAEFAELDLDELTTLIERSSRKRLGREKAQDLQHDASNSLGLTALGPTARLEIRALLSQIALLEEQVKQTDAAVATLLEPLDQQLTSIPGIGAVLAATILAEIGDVSRFPRFQSLVAYAGIDPTVFESGQFHGRRQHLSKRGSPTLRRALYLATHSAQLYNPDLKTYLQKKLQEGKPYKEAVVATSRKLLARIYTVLKQGRPFEVRPEQGRPFEVRPAGEV